jgi:predicted GNAT family acetyltransferase
MQDDEPALTVRAAVIASARPVSGLLGGPAHQVAIARNALGLDTVTAAFDEQELLMAVDLDRLIFPSTLVNRNVVVRRGRQDDMNVLVGWSHDYRVETLHETPGSETRASAHEMISGQLEAGRLFVAEGVGGELCAMASFNAALPEMVQLGGVYTPPSLRRRGYCQAVIAGALTEARSTGVTRAVLFTDGQNPASTRAYAHVGFHVIGDYGIVLFGREITVPPMQVA